MESESTPTIQKRTATTMPESKVSVHLQYSAQRNASLQLMQPKPTGNTGNPVDVAMEEVIYYQVACEGSLNLRRIFMA